MDDGGLPQKGELEPQAPQPETGDHGQRLDYASVMGGFKDTAAMGAEAALGAMGGLDTFNKLRHSRLPHSPDREPDLTAQSGARIWHDKHGDTSCIKDANGQIFQIHHDKHGRIKQVVEPDGSRLSRQGDSNEWVRLNTKGEKTSFVGDVTLNETTGEVRYIAASGYQTIYNGNGSRVEVDHVEGRNVITRLADAKGRTTEISYDADLNPFSIKNPDGSLLVLGTDNKWYRSIPGTGIDTYVPYKIHRDNDSGNVVVETPDSIVVLGQGGMDHIARKHS